MFRSRSMPRLTGNVGGVPVYRTEGSTDCFRLFVWKMVYHCLVRLCFPSDELKRDPYWKSFSDVDWEYWPEHEWNKTRPGRYTNPFYQTSARSFASYTVGLFYIAIIHLILQRLMRVFL